MLLYLAVVFGEAIGQKMGSDSTRGQGVRKYVRKESVRGHSQLLKEKLRFLLVSLMDNR